MKVPDLFVGKQLICGINATSPKPITALGIGPAEIRGSGYIEGPLIVGDETKFSGGVDNATLLLSNCTNTDAPLAGGIPASILKIRSSIVPSPTDVIIGDPAGAVGVSFYCTPQPFSVTAQSINFTAAVYNSSVVTRSETASASKDTSAKVDSGAKVEVGVDHNVSNALNSAPTISKSVIIAADFRNSNTTLNTTYEIATKALAKNFDVPHPTKEGWRLRHTCLEGPANDVYIRGRLSGQNIIQLPDYWKGLVNLETITVNLTPMGSYQELYYEMGPWGSSVKVMNSAGGAVNCSYLIHAERVDVEKLIPEYEGTTPNDYPGDNSQYVINGGINNQIN
jgi:hypothetical protein